jgi:hypothetical protein
MQERGREEPHTFKRQATDNLFEHTAMGQALIIRNRPATKVPAIRPQPPKPMLTYSLNFRQYYTKLHKKKRGWTVHECTRNDTNRLSVSCRFVDRLISLYDGNSV